MSCPKALLAAILALSFVQAEIAWAADAYPNHTVTIIVPTPPGGGNDIAARLIAEQLSEQMPQKFIVGSKIGAGGILGAKFVADSKPDGYTLLLFGPTMTISPYLLPHLDIDVEHDLTPITEIASSAMTVVVNSSIPVKNMSELMAYAKSHPDTFTWGAPLGSPSYFCIAQINMMSGVKATIAPFSGAEPAFTSLLGGEISAAVVVPTLIKGQTDKLRPLATTSKESDDETPGIPSVASTGPAYASFDTTIWYGLWGPKNMPKELVTQIQQAVTRAMARPELRAKYKTNGMIAHAANTPDVFGAFVSSEVNKNKAIIDAGHLRQNQ